MQILTEKKCKRCLWQWFPRSIDEPTICPHCKSPYWNKERKGGRPKNYQVVVQYEYDDRKRGDIISSHATRELAEKASKKTGRDSFHAIRDKRDYER